MGMTIAKACSIIRSLPDEDLTALIGERSCEHCYSELTCQCNEKIPCIEQIALDLEYAIIPKPEKENDIVYRAMIPIEPKTKKNNMKIIRCGDKFRIAQSDIYKQYEQDCMLFLRAPKEPINYPVSVQYTFERETARRVDQSNLIEAADDVLVKAGVLKDDNATIVRDHDGSRVKLKVGEGNGKTKIIIRRVPKEEKE